MEAERVAILIVVYTLYLSSGTYWLSVVAPFVFDAFLIVTMTYAGMNLELRKKAIVLYLVNKIGISALTVWIGATLNSFFSYAFDLTFYRGATPVMVSIVFLMYGWFKICFWDHREDWRRSNFLYVALLLSTVACTETIVFSEPWTFTTFFVYFISVWIMHILTSVSLVKRPTNLWISWTPFIFFVVFWSGVIGLSMLIDLDRKHELKTYFNQKEIKMFD